jgi:hypothetical protein
MLTENQLLNRPVRVNVSRGLLHRKDCEEYARGMNERHVQDERDNLLGSS